MKYTILDTNFILSCIRKKIDFFEKIPLMGMKIIIPSEVIDEIRKFSRQGRGNLKQEAKLALVILENQEFKRVDLCNKNVDNGIIKLAEKNRDYIIATLDTGIKNETKNSILLIRGEKELEVM
ncbi:MAG: PIN domain-containing protein [Candidatus Pacearchaeota archaeon]|nr:PIN domain-containing protein [Candidatus Pacearchaeota archaeon]